MRRLSRPSWDQSWMSQVYSTCARSHDPRTHVGAVIVSQDNRLRVTGYNGLPSGIEPEAHPELLQAPEKLYWCEHAERNALYIAARKGIALEGCKCYVNFMPCVDCARGLIQAGVVEVIYHQQCQDHYVAINPNHNYVDSFARLDKLFSLTGRVLRAYDGPIGLPLPLINGQPFDFTAAGSGAKGGAVAA